MAAERGGEEKPSADLNNGSLRKAVKTAGKNLERVRKTAVLSFFWAHVRKLEASVREDDQQAFIGA